MSERCHMDDIEVRDFKRFYTLVETLKIHGQIEYGTDEIDVDSLVAFLKSNRTGARFFSCNEMEMEERIMNDIIAGAPVWTFFKLPKWTKNIMTREWEKTLAEEKAKEERAFQEAVKKYKCLQQCRYYECGESSFGTFIRCSCYECKCSGDDFKYKARCSHYQKDERKTDRPMYIGN